MTRKAAHNRRLAQWRVKWLIEHSTSHQLLWCIDSFVLRNPPLRQAPKRWWQLLNHNKMKTLLTIFMVLIASVLNGQVLFNKTYSKPFWDYADAVIERKDGNYLVAGSSRSQSNSDYDVNILLVDSLGTLIWDKYIGQPGRYEFGYSLIETNDNNFLIAGRVNNSNPYLLKFNSTGNLIWDREYISSSWSEGFSIGETIDSNYFFIKPDLATTLYIINSQGDSLWAKKYDNGIYHSIISTSDNGFILAGKTKTINEDNDISLFKINSVGDSLWMKTFGGNGEDDAMAVQQLADNGYLVAGIYDPQIVDGESATYIIRTNTIGDTLWTQKYFLGVPQYIMNSKNNTGYILSTTKVVTNWLPYPDEHYIIITKLDTLGNIIWSKQFKGYNYALGNNISETTDGGFLLTGYIDNYPNNADIILIKLDSLGNYVLSTKEILIKQDLQLKVFPIPTNTEINFSLNSLNGNKINQVKIFDVCGKVVEYTTGLSENNYRIELENFPSGLYFYEIITNKNQNLTGKFIVQ